MIQKVVGRANQAGLQTKRSRRESNNPQVRAHDLGIGQKLAIHAFAFDGDHVSFVNQNQIERPKVAGAFVDRLDPGHDHRRLGFAFSQSGRIDAELDVRTDLLEFLGRLFEQLFNMGKDQDASLPVLNGISTDGRHHGRLAAASGNHHARIVIPGSQVFIDGSNSLFLIGAQRDHG